MKKTLLISTVTLTALVLFAFLFLMIPKPQKCIQKTSCSTESLAKRKELAVSYINPINYKRISGILLQGDDRDAVSILTYLNTQDKYKERCTDHNLAIVRGLLPLLSIDKLPYLFFSSGHYCNSTLKGYFLLFKDLSDSERSAYLAKLCTNDSDLRSCIDTIGLVSYLSKSSPVLAQRNCEMGYKDYSKENTIPEEGFINGCYMGYMRASFEHGFWKEKMSLSARYSKLCNGTTSFAYKTCSGDITRYFLLASANKDEYLANLAEINKYCSTLLVPTACAPYIAYATVDYLAKLNIKDTKTTFEYFSYACLKSKSKECMLNFLGWHSELGTWDNPELYKPYALVPLCKLLSKEWLNECLSELKENEELHIIRESQRHA